MMFQAAQPGMTQPQQPPQQQRRMTLGTSKPQKSSKVPPNQSIGKKQMMVVPQQEQQRVVGHAALNSMQMKLAVGPPTQHRNHTHQQISKVQHEMNRQTITDEGNTGSSGTGEDLTPSSQKYLNSEEEEKRVVHANMMDSEGAKINPSSAMKETTTVAKGVRNRSSKADTSQSRKVTQRSTRIKAPVPTQQMLQGQIRALAVSPKHSLMMQSAAATAIEKQYSSSRKKRSRVTKSTSGTKIGAAGMAMHNNNDHSGSPVVKQFIGATIGRVPKRRKHTSPPIRNHSIKQQKDNAQAEEPKDQNPADVSLSAAKATKRSKQSSYESTSQPELKKFPEKTGVQDGEEEVKSQESQGDHAAAEERSFDEEATYQSDKIEDKVNKMAISGSTTVQHKASQRKLQFAELEEEKEVPSEHPFLVKVTPSGNVCNATTRPGLSFETKNNLGGKLQSQMMEQPSIAAAPVGQKKERLVEADFVLIAQPAHGNFLTDITESELTNKSINIAEKPTFPLQLATTSQESVKAKIPQGGTQMRSLVEKQGDNLSFISAENSVEQSRKQSQSLNNYSFEGGQAAEDPSNESASIEENKAVMALHQLRQTQMMPSVVLHHPLNSTDPQHVLYEQYLMKRQLQNDQDRDGSTRVTKSRQNNAKNLLAYQKHNNYMHQSLASCDLQDTFQKSDMKSSPHETQNRAKTMMRQHHYNFQMHAIKQPAYLGFDQITGPALGGNFKESGEIEHLLESQEYQAISKTRLWREIFYLRDHLTAQNAQIQHVYASMEDLQEQLAQQKQRNSELVRQLQQKGNMQDTSRQQQPQQSHFHEEESKQYNSMSRQLPPILQCEQQINRSMVNQPIQKNFVFSETESIESASLRQSQVFGQTNQYAVTEEMDLGYRNAPNLGIQRATQANNLQHRQSRLPPQVQQTQSEQERLAALQSQPISMNEARPRLQQLEHEQQQMINYLSPPTAGTMQQRILQNNFFSDDAQLNQVQEDSAHALPPQNQGTVHATAGALPGQRLYDQSMQASFLEQTTNRVGEENNQFTSNESALINKVNEMQTKTASFGYQQHQQQAQPANPRAVLYRQENPRGEYPDQQQTISSSSQRIQYQPDDALGMTESIQPTMRQQVTPVVQQQAIMLQPDQAGADGLSIAEQEQFMEYEIDEQVANGVRLMAGPRSGPARSNLRLRQANENRQLQQLMGQQQARNTNGLPNGGTFGTQNPQLHQQRPCDQPPPRNIRGDIQGNFDFEDIATAEGVGSGMVPQQRIPLPNQQQQPMPRQPSHDSLLDPDISFSFSQQQQQSSQQLRPLRQNPNLRQLQQLSVADDAGMDEFDVADERLHLFGEQVNPDIMTYEQLLALQERIGFVPKGMTVQEMEKYPTMKRAEVKRYLRRKQLAAQQHQNHHELGGDQTLLQSFHSQQPLPSMQPALYVGNATELLEEEKKSHQESLCDKSLLSHGNSSSDLAKKSSQLSNAQHENYQSLHLNQRSSTVFVNETNIGNSLPQLIGDDQAIRQHIEMMSQVSHQARQRNFKVPMIELKDGDESGLSHLNLYQNNSVGINAHEEGKEDLEEAAPEEHHPKEEHLQQIGVSVPMPGHHIVANRSQPQASNYGVALSNDTLQVQTTSRRRRQMRPSSSIEEDQNGSQDVSQEDVFDEGEDVLNRRLPIVVNINGSTPNQRPPARAHYANNPQNVMLEAQLTASVQASDEVRRPKAREFAAAGGGGGAVGNNEEDFAHSSNVYEEHKADEIGVQTPKYAQTKTNQKRQNSRQVEDVDMVMTQQTMMQRQRGAALPTMVKHHYQQQQDGVNLQLVKQQFSNKSTTSLAVRSNASVASTTLGQEVCIICQEIFLAEDPVKMLTPCSHYFHVNCVNQWLLVEKKCPMCMHTLQ